MRASSTRSILQYSLISIILICVESQAPGGPGADYPGGPPAEYPGGPPEGQSDEYSGGPPGQYPGGPPPEPVNYTMLPTSSNWRNFQCFNDEEIASIRQEYNITSEKLAIWKYFKYQVDDWSLDSLAWSILHRELLGIDVELFQFYDGAESLIKATSEAAVFHNGIFEKDYLGRGPGVDKATAATHSKTKWRMRSDVRDEIEAYLGANNDNENLFLGHWRLFSHPAVIKAMNSSDEVVIQPDEDGNFVCGVQHGCLHGDSTWYPPQCDPTLNARCMVLLQFLPEHDMELNRNLITEHQLPMVIKYLGSEQSPIGRSNFQRFYEERSRVIFQLRSGETQSLDQMGWTSIAMPNDHAIISKESIVRLKPSWLLHKALHLYIMHELSSLSPIQTQMIQMSIFAANQPETVDLRMNAVCDWLKHPMNAQFSPFSWKFWLVILKSAEDQSLSLTEYDCETLTDEDLEYILSKSDDEILASPLSGEFIFDGIDIQLDSYSSIYVKRHCVTDFKEQKDAMLQIIGFILWGLAVAVLIAVTAGTIYWRKKKIIVASSVNMLGLIFLGAAITLLYQMFLEDDILSHCYARKYTFQVGFVMMFAALEEKTRRLATIQINIKLLKSVKITDFQLMLRIGAVLSLVIIYLTVLVAVYPIEIKERIVNRQRKAMCEWDEGAETAYVALVAAEVVALLMIGRLSWSLRTTNELSILRNLSILSLLPILFCDCHFLKSVQRDAVDRIYSFLLGSDGGRLFDGWFIGSDIKEHHRGVLLPFCIGGDGAFCVNDEQIQPHRTRYSL